MNFQNGKTSESEEGEEEKEEREEETKHREEEEDEEKEQEQEEDNKKKKKKNKSKQKDKRLLKKEARDLRAKAMSEDLQLFKFSSVNLPQDEMMDVTGDVVQNGDAHGEPAKPRASSQKRIRERTTAEGGKVKRRKDTGSRV